MTDQQQLADRAADAMRRPAGYRFDSTSIIPRADLERLTELRVMNPDYIKDALAARPRRKHLTADGRLALLAADHPARMVCNLGSDPAGMANRADYLSRIVRVLAGSRVDGLMATPDIIEEIVTLDAMARERGEAGFLGQRILIGSMNRSGLNGATHELWDMPSAYITAEDLVAASLDGAKILWRYTSEGDANREALETMTALADTCSAVANFDLPMFIEPLAVEYHNEKWALSADETAWIRVVSAASSLGPTTLRSWLKIPFLRPYGRIVAATTHPILMLGGPSTGKPESLLVDFAEGMQTAANVRGALVGRNVLYPGDEDPAVAAEAVYHIVHGRLSAEKSAAEAARVRMG